MTDLTTPWETVERAKAGDREAFAEIYRNCHTPILRFVYHRTGSQEIAEDITGEVWVRALRRIGGVEFLGRDIQAWLTTIARNLIADYYKSGRYRIERVSDEHARWDRVDESRYVDPEASLIADRTVEVVRAAIERLTPDQKQAIQLRYLQGFSTSVAAELMAREEGALKALLFRASRSLAADKAVQAVAS